MTNGNKSRGPYLFRSRFVRGLWSIREINFNKLYCLTDNALDRKKRFCVSKNEKEENVFHQMMYIYMYISSNVVTTVTFQLKDP